MGSGIQGGGKRVQDMASPAGEGRWAEDLCIGHAEHGYDVHGREQPRSQPDGVQGAGDRQGLQRRGEFRVCSGRQPVGGCRGAVGEVRGRRRLLPLAGVISIPYNGRCIEQRTETTRPGTAGAGATTEDSADMDKKTDGKRRLSRRDFLKGCPWASPVRWPWERCCPR